MNVVESNQVQNCNWLWDLFCFHSLQLVLLVDVDGKAKYSDFYCSLLDGVARSSSKEEIQMKRFENVQSNDQ